jgi:hypothetical protein
VRELLSLASGLESLSAKIDTARAARANGIMDRAQAEAELDEEWMAAYNKYHENYSKHIELMMEIKEKVAVMIEPPKIEKKGKKQRKRDIFANAH